MSQGDDRVEDLEEALRKIVAIIDPLHAYRDIDKERAVMSIAVDALGLDPAPPVVRHPLC